MMFRSQRLVDRLSIGIYLRAPSPHANERKVGRATADIADQDGLPWGQLMFPRIRMTCQPGIAGSLWLFDRQNAFESRCGGRFNRQLSRNLIK